MKQHEVWIQGNESRYYVAANSPSEALEEAWETYLSYDFLSWQDTHVIVLCRFAGGFCQRSYHTI